MWIGGPTGGYRVHDVAIYDRETDSWRALELQETYRLAGYNYTLRNSGDGYNMFSCAVNVIDYVMEDYMVLANYAQSFENKTVLASNSPLLDKYPGFGIDYGTVNGSGRIVNAPTDHTPEPTEEPTNPEETAEVPATTEVPDIAAESVPFPVIPLVVAVISLMLIVCSVLYYVKRTKETEK